MNLAGSSFTYLDILDTLKELRGVEVTNGLKSTEENIKIIINNDAVCKFVYYYK